MDLHPAATKQFRIVNSTVKMADALAGIQQACFPELSDGERIRAKHYRSHVRIFPDGQFAVLNSAEVPVASSTDLICRMDFDHYQHRYMEACGNNWLTTHDATGDWLYGVDIGVHPEYRGQGLSRLLYDTRKDLIRRLNLKGHVAGGIPVGYGAVKSRMTIEDYVSKVKADEIFDPTISVQLRRGFSIAGVLNDYLEDTSCDGKAVLLVWHNPDYQES